MEIEMWIMIEESLRTQLFTCSQLLLEGSMIVGLKLKIVRCSPSLPPWSILKPFMPCHMREWERQFVGLVGKLLGLHPVTVSKSANMIHLRLFHSQKSELPRWSVAQIHVSNPANLNYRQALCRLEFLPFHWNKLKMLVSPGPLSEPPLRSDTGEKSTGVNRL